MSAGGGGVRSQAAGFLHVGHSGAARDRARYPRAMVEVVGCPKMDDVFSGKFDKEPGRLPVLSAHFNCGVVPETRTAFFHFERVLPQLVRDFGLAVHSHPKGVSMIRPRVARLGAEFIQSFRDVMARADVYIVDNSSTLYEFAAAERLVVVLNAPCYRRDVHHGLRFWEHIPGPQVDRPEELLPALEAALSSPDEWAERRREAVEAVYAFTDARSASRAADALLNWRDLRRI